MLAETKYEDSKFKWIGIPFFVLFVVHIGLDAPFWALLKNWLYYENILFSLFIGYAIFFSTKKLILYFDKQAPWEKTNISKRWKQQLLLSSLITSFWLVINDLHDFFSAEQDPLLDNILLLLDWPLSLLLTAGINYYYYILYQTRLAKINVGSTGVASTEVKEKVLLKTFSGYQQEWLGDIAYIYLENKITYVVDRQGQEKVVDQTLSSIEEKLKDSKFDYFRINRKAIIHRDQIKKYSIISGYKILIELSPQPSFPCIVSKNKAASFKQWFHHKP